LFLPSQVSRHVFEHIIGTDLAPPAHTLEAPRLDILKSRGLSPY
jgi:hypothetical protein